MSAIIPHTITPDIQEVLDTNPDIAMLWNTLTPLTQNEWICWITFFKKPETRAEHLIRLKEDLLKGKRRPCCWSGCPHRPDHPKKVYTAKRKLKVAK
jgi:Bacteriocin-protection, YdeI or OmpD-Associated